MKYTSCIIIQLESKKNTDFRVRLQFELEIEKDELLGLK